MSLSKLYKLTDENELAAPQYGGRIFVQGRRPHDQLENGFTPDGAVYDVLVMVLESQIEYTNLLDNQTITGTYPQGDEIYGRFSDADITITSGMVRAYKEYPTNSKS